MELLGVCEWACAGHQLEVLWVFTCPDMVAMVTRVTPVLTSEVLISVT